MSEQQSLIEVKKALPSELMNRFDAFLVSVQERVSESESALLNAKEFNVDSEAAYQVADTVLASLKSDAKALNDERLALTRPIDDFKAQFTEAAKPAIDNYTQAQGIYSGLMSAYRRAEQEKARKAQLEAERVLAEQKRKEEEAARKLREKAARLKSEEAKQRALQEAETREQAAQMMPTSVALSSAQPQTVASNVSELWRAEIKDVPKFLEWLITRPEWLCVLTFKDSEMNRLAKQCQNVVKVPGVEFHTKDSFRTKSR